MKFHKSFLFLALLSALTLAACSGLPKPACTSNCTQGTASVSLVMVSDTLPANLGLISFKATVNSVDLTSSTGTKTTLSLNGGKGVTVDLVRLQSDSAFLGTVPNVPTGTNSSITLSFAPAVQLAFFNGTGATITNLTPQCLASTVCSVPFTVAGTPVITSSLTVTGNTGFGIDFNLANSLTLTGTSLSVNLSNSGTSNVVSAFALPRTNSNMPSGKLDLIEDFTGIVTVGSPGVTIVSATAVGRGSIAAATTSTTNYDQDPSGNLCKTGTTQLANCVSNNQAASMDVLLNADGTFSVQEIEPLLATLNDTVEGTVVAINPSNQTQFAVITTDMLPAATSLLGSLNIGDFLTVNLNNPTFLVDTKGLPMTNSDPTSFDTFFGQTNTTALHVGQSVAVHVTAFTAASGTTPAAATTDTVTLRWSRFIATPTGPSAPGLFNITALPGYFGFVQSNILAVQIFAGSQGFDGVTNLDGFAYQSAPGTAPAAIRALYLNTPGNTLNPAFFAAKVRQH
jgi:hypothetical protein